MNAPVKADVDPRLAFLARAAVANILVEAGELDLAVAFNSVAELLRRMDFAARGRPCDICDGICRNPSFCRACRRADWQRRTRR
jgi:hypothetical protein